MRFKEHEKIKRQFSFLEDFLILIVWTDKNIKIWNFKVVLISPTLRWSHFSLLFVKA